MFWQSFWSQPVYLGTTTCSREPVQPSSKQQASNSQSPQTPGLALRLATMQRRTKIWEGGPTPARSRSQDISGPFMGTGPSGAHATLSSVVVSLMLAYPHSSALHPCSSRFLFDCDLLPSHRGPQLSTH